MAPTTKSSKQKTCSDFANDEPGFDENLMKKKLNSRKLWAEEELYLQVKIERRSLHQKNMKIYHCCL